MKKAKSVKKNQPDSLLKQGLKASKAVLVTVAIFSFFCEFIHVDPAFLYVAGFRSRDVKSK